MHVHFIRGYKGLGYHALADGELLLIRRTTSMLPGHRTYKNTYVELGRAQVHDRCLAEFPSKYSKYRTI
jgi:hypothetical protein